MRSVVRVSSSRTVLTWLAALSVAVALAATPAVARSKRVVHRPDVDASKYSAIVVDARTGEVLQAENADAARFPASLTKMMTLYLTFEALSKGTISKATEVPFSQLAAAQPPTKLGVKAGNSIPVETAIYALVTRSANDAAMALGELLGGSKDNFAAMMTAKAEALGMTNTVFRNPNGLPDPYQHTSARDMARLGIALREHFPQYYGYFSVADFRYRGQRIANHNRLLGRIRGIDGIKTGYTNASGYNLVTSVVDGNRKLVAVVLGGVTAGGRDRRMQQLIAANLEKARTSGGGNVIARVETPKIAAMTAMFAAASQANPTAKVLRAKNAIDQVMKDDDEIAARAVEAVARTTTVASLAQITTPSRASVAEAAPTTVPSLDPVQTASIGPGGWAVQVGASPAKDQAKATLEKASAKGGAILASAEAFTVPFEKGGITYFRARFGGFASQGEATKACNQLKRKQVPCYAVQQ